MSDIVRIPASRTIEESGWVGSESDIEKLVSFFEDVRNEIVRTASNNLEINTQVIRAEQAARLTYYEGEELNRKLDAAVQAVKEDTLQGIGLEMTLAEEVRYPANAPRSVLQIADLPSTKSFSLDIRSDYRSRSDANDAAVSLDVRSTGVTATVTSSDRTFIEGTCTRLERLLAATAPPRKWMISPWFSGVTYGLLNAAAMLSVFFFFVKFTGFTSLDVVPFFVLVALLVSFLSGAVHTLFWRRWRPNFPTVQIYRDGEKPLAERANRMLVKSVGTVISVVLIPILLTLILGN